MQHVRRNIIGSFWNRWLNTTEARWVLRWANARQCGCLGKSFGGLRERFPPAATHTGSSSNRFKKNTNKKLSNHKKTIKLQSLTTVGINTAAETKLSTALLPVIRFRSRLPYSRVRQMLVRWIVVFRCAWRHSDLSDVRLVVVGVGHAHVCATAVQWIGEGANCKGVASQPSPTQLTK